MNDLKTVRDALEKGLSNTWQDQARKVEIENILSTIDRMIETPTPTKCTKVAFEWAKYRMNLMKDEKRELQKSGAPLEVSHQYDDEIDIYETICSALQISKPAQTEKTIDWSELDKIRKTTTGKTRDQLDAWSYANDTRKAGDNTPTERVDVEELKRQLINSPDLPVFDANAEIFLNYLYNTGRLR